jgi:NADPH:quinone reductase-like Zn-dependent oxidoreductase
MSTMKAVRLHAYGGPENLAYEDVPMPVAGPGQALVQIKAASINPLDWKIREGYVRAGIPLDLPVIMGCDMAGVISALGPDMEGFHVGDEVFAMVGRTGAYAEAVAVDAAKLAKKPSNIDFHHAAAAPLAALTAWQFLFQWGELKAGQRVLIHAGGGGVGGFAVQFAHHAGAHVVATASAGKLDYVRGLGADEVIDYGMGSFENGLSDIDLVIDLIGGETRDRTWGVIKPGGRLISAAGQPDPEAAKAAGVIAMMAAVKPVGADLAEIGALYQAGAVKSTIAHAFPLSQAADAQELVKAGGTQGKVILTV